MAILVPLIPYESYPFAFVSFADDHTAPSLISHTQRKRTEVCMASMVTKEVS